MFWKENIVAEDFETYKYSVVLSALQMRATQELEELDISEKISDKSDDAQYFEVFQEII